MVQATYDDANLILKLYDLRREAKMREARAWFIANFKPKAMKDIQDLCPPGSENSARMRMVVTYWDMAASFVNSGVLNPELFFANCRESLVVWLRVQALVPEMRAAFKDQTMWHNLEEVSKHFIDWLNKTSPGAFEAFAARIG
jgi:hypothetical protein